MGLAGLGIVSLEGNRVIVGGAIDICSKDEDEEYELMKRSRGGLSSAKGGAFYLELTRVLRR